MANSFLGTPPVWILDTASATAVSTDVIRPYSMVWVSATAAPGDLCIVQDKNGKEIWRSVAPGPNFDGDEFRAPDKSFNMQGFILQTLSSGTLRVYLR